MFRLYGLEPGSIEIDYEKYRSLLHPDDRDIGRGSSSITRSRQDAPFSYDHRVIRPDGEERDISTRAGR